MKIIFLMACLWYTVIQSKILLWSSAKVFKKANLTKRVKIMLPSWSSDSVVKVYLMKYNYNFESEFLLFWTCIREIFDGLMIFQYVLV